MGIWNKYGFVFSSAATESVAAELNLTYKKLWV
jgi:hypothetical protein